MAASKKYKKKTPKKSKRVISIKKKHLLISIISLLIVAGILFILFSDKQKEPPTNEEPERNYALYNGYVFEKHPQLQDFWVTYIKMGDGEQKFEARIHPLDIEEYSFNEEINQYFLLTQLAEGTVSMSFSEEVLLQELAGYVGIAGYELGRVLRSYFNYDIVIGKKEEVKGLEEYPFITCENASIENIVIEFLHGETGIEFSPFCVNIYFDKPQDSVKMSYLLIYHLFGIMD